MNADDFLPDLKRFEGLTTWMYRDTNEAGLVTTGVGNMLPTPAAAAELEWWVGNTRKATPDEVHAAFAAVKAAAPGKLAASYKRFTVVRLDPPYAERLALDRLAKEFLPGIRELFDGFDEYPDAAQRVIVDMAYNMGLGLLAKFHHLREACAASNWAQAAEECHVASSRPDRNDWRRGLFESLVEGGAVTDPA